MNSDVIELKRPSRSIDDFFNRVSEDELMARLNGEPQLPVAHRSEPSSVSIEILDPDLETNSRLTIIKMFEKAPEYGQPFTFRVRRYTGESYIQAMRTTMSKARKIMKEQNLDAGEPFKMLVLSLDTLTTCDEITVTRSPKGIKNLVKLTELAKLMGSSVQMEDEDD